MGAKNIVMLTGDNGMAAKAVSASIGIDGYQANLLPEQKLEVVKELQQKGQIMPLPGRCPYRCLLKQDHLPQNYTIQHHQLATPSSDLPVLLLRDLILILNVTH